MRILFALYTSLTRFFGARRRFVRRIAGLSLVVLGVHLAADRFDDLLYGLIDQGDLAADSAAWSLLEWLASLGAFSVQEAAAHAQRFAEWVDLEEKDLFSKWAALALELLVDLRLLDFAWGERMAAGRGGEPESRTRLVDGLRESSEELGQALWPLDLERLSVPLVLFALSAAGALSASLAFEGFVAGLLAEAAPGWRWGTNLSAALGLLAAALVIWRFVPDLLHGGITRAHARGDAALARRPVSTGRTKASRSAKLWKRLLRGLRGSFLALIVLPIAWLSLASQGAVFGLIARTGAGL